MRRNISGCLSGVALDSIKQVMNIQKHKPTIQLCAALMLIFVGCGLLIAGFIMHPPGEIHNSVLIAFGETLTFAGALFGIDYHYKYRNNDNSQ